MNNQGIRIYFSDFFNVSPEALEEYGALNISLINDMPLFIDPFLLFSSDKPEYQYLHNGIIQYLKFLRDYSCRYSMLDKDTRRELFQFPEIKQNWLGFSLSGNSGSGLGSQFGDALFANLGKIFTEFGKEHITQASHLEKLCIVAPGVGRDNISDFTTNLVFEYLLRYTEQFAIKNIDPSLLRSFSVQHVNFDYNLGCWQRQIFRLPCHKNTFVILTPRDILTRDNTWINQPDMLHDIEKIAEALPDGQLRANLNRYLSDVLDDEVPKKEQQKLVLKFYQNNPELVDYFIRNKEDRKDEAIRRSEDDVFLTEDFFIIKAKQLSSQLESKGFYASECNSVEAARARIIFLKDVIENQDGYKLFYIQGKPLKRESDLQIMYRLTWFGSRFDVNREVNNGRGPVDFKISSGSEDKDLVEMKLASNSKIKQNLQHQVEIYQKANNTVNAFKVILCFSEQEIIKTNRILKELGLSETAGVYIINASPDKISASNVKSAITQ